jgi:hypothetical protein
MCLPGALMGLVELILGLCRLDYSSARYPTANGILDAFRQAVIEAADSQAILQWGLTYGFHVVVAVAGLLLLRARGPLMVLLRRSS